MVLRHANGGSAHESSVSTAVLVQNLTPGEVAASGIIIGVY
jgi:hypothetical protein